MILGLFLIETSLSLFFCRLFLQPFSISSISYPFRVVVCFPMEADVNMTAHGNGIEWQIELWSGIMCQYGRCTQSCLCGPHWLVAPVSADSVSRTRMDIGPWHFFVNINLMPLKMGNRPALVLLPLTAILVCRGMCANRPLLILLYKAMEPVNTHAHACQNFTSKQRVLVAPLHQQVMQKK